MQQFTNQSAASDGKAYLAAVEELTLEIKRAIAVIAQGALSEFEDSLIRQRIGCTRISELALLHSGSATPPLEDADPSLTNSIRIATSDFEAVTRQYAMLLKHFGETTRIFAGVFRTVGLPQAQSTWSCEI
ncbi:MAG: hypothetical protein ACRYFU_07805 [Janthinobacterium lividum]